MKAGIILCAFALFMVAICIAVPIDELPFGAFYTNSTSSEEIGRLHSTLGFNLFVLQQPSISLLNEFSDTGITVIERGDANETVHGLTNYHYVKIEAEERESRVRMYNCGGGDIVSEGDTTFWVSYNDSEDTLFGPNNSLPPCDFDDPTDYNCLTTRSKYIESDIGDTIFYHIDIRAKIDIRNGSDTVAAYLKVVPGTCSGRSVDTSFVWELKDSDFAGSDTWTTITRNFHLADTVIVCTSNCDDTTSWHLDILTAKYYTLTALIVTTGDREVGIDWIKIYDDDGKLLTETDYYSTQIDNFVSSYTDDYVDSLWGWCVVEPTFTTIPVASAVLDTARAYGEADWGGMTLINSRELYDYWFEIVNSNVLGQYYYPFIINRGNISESLSYVGYSETNPQYFLQSRLNTVTGRYYLAYQSANSADAELWHIPQAYTGCPEPEARWPTHSEFLCETYMALAHGARGILYWKYGACSACTCLSEQSDSVLWYTIKDDLNPYIKAIDEIFMGLEHDTTYIVDPNSSFPSGSSGFIDSIIAVTNPDSLGDTTNPDLGWFHIGEFRDSTDDMYFMLVNRACSRNVNGIEAPSITAIVELRRSAFNNATSLFVIDIDHDYNSSDWVAQPETTYTALYNNDLYYTTVLKAGEGRLFKIIPPGTPTSANDYVYQGEYNYSGTLTISSSDTLRYKCPTKLTFPQGDTLIVRGGLLTSGCNDTSLGYVKFTSPDTAAWYGVHFINSNALGKLDYCQIDNVNQYKPCILIDSSAVLEINNSMIDDGQISIHIKNSGYLNVSSCLFTGNQTGIFNESGDSLHVTNCNLESYSTSGITLYTGQLQMDSTDFDDIGYYGIYAKNTDLTAVNSNFYEVDYYGIYADSSESFIEDCDFGMALRYGIYINSHPSPGTYDSTIIKDCTVSFQSVPDPDVSQYCIQVNNNDEVRLDGNTLSDYNQGGIYLYNSNAIVKNSDIELMGNYGLYATNNSDASLRNCTFDSTYIGLYCNDGSQPKIRYSNFYNLKTGVRNIDGDSPYLGKIFRESPPDTGWNDLEDCDSYYIYKDSVGLEVEFLWAQGNYFGSSGPDTSKFKGISSFSYQYWLSDSIWQLRPQPKTTGEFETPFTYYLNGAFPNPFNPVTNIQYSLAEPGYTIITIYNILGQKITTLVDEYKQADRYSIPWNSTDSRGQPVASGVYFIKLVSDDFVDSKKMLLLR